MLNYPSSGDIIRVKDIRQRSGCRAYRVFNHYIDKLISELVDGGLEEQEAMDRVFLCRRDDSAVLAGCEVYACTTCKAKCEYKENGVSKYEQCKYKDYDLFDGHSARGYTSIGIGEEQRPELAALTMPERMSLAVLKVPPPHSSPDRRAASTAPPSPHSSSLPRRPCLCRCSTPPSRRTLGQGTCTRRAARCSCRATSGDSPRSSCALLARSLAQMRGCGERSACSACRIRS